ncbi:6,7-dimethyl-8-ribityllumazine synthase [Chlamydiales bacterium SCGC AG-110-P3]|nr:6,7-dimethyl-8-ribityllumazine synthase [Chlamydiales bacterium SCGC AG-110-P3]
MPSAPKEINGTFTDAPRARIAIVAARFNGTIVNNLLQGAISTLIQHGVDVDNITVCWVPGAFELPLAAKRWALSHQIDAVICLGTVIRGATPHFDYVCGQAASGITSVALETETPVIFGVLTTETIEQAIERSGTKAGNKGSDSALAALEMISVIRQINDIDCSSVQGNLDKLSPF